MLQAMDINLLSLILHQLGMEKFRDVLALKPKKSTHIAVSKNNYGSIFYQKENDRFFIYSGDTWSELKNVSEDELRHSLSLISCLFVDIPSIELVISNPLKLDSFDFIEVLRKSLKLRSDLCQQRLNNDSGYWQGHIDAYEIIEKLIDSYKVG